MRIPPAGPRPDGTQLLDVRPLAPDLLPDLARLFATTAMTNRCFCTWFLLSGRERERVWAAGAARMGLEEFARSAPAPVGVLAYRDDVAVGWCAAAPRASYPVLLRSPLHRDRDHAEDGSVWFASCFYVHRSARHQGVTHSLLKGVLDVAASAGAVAVEGPPRADGDRVGALEAYVGAECVFTAAGFAVVRRPSARRVLMRRTLAP